LTYTLVADVGGTGTRLARMLNGQIAGVPALYNNRDFLSFTDILASYLADQAEAPRQMGLAVAGPVTNQSVTLTNLGWNISAAALAEHFGIGQVVIVNDCVAIAWATIGLSSADLVKLGGGTPADRMNRGVIGPGTGLGVSGLIATESDWEAIASEGGHVSMAALNSEEAELVARIAEEFGHCSAERLLSGPGLARIHAFNGYAESSPERITELARRGDPLARKSVQMFCSLLGTVAGNLALTLGARGGIYLAGRKLPQISDLMAASGFRSRFEAKGRFNHYLAAIPTCIITRPHPSFLGLDIYLRRGKPI